MKAQLARAPMETMVGFESNWQAMERIIATARAQGTRVAVVVTPYYPGYIEKLGNFEAFFAELKNRLPADVPMIDARRAVQREEAFTDALHVNQDGVRAMFAAMTPELQQLGTCPVDAIAQLSEPAATGRH